MKNKIDKLIYHLLWMLIQYTNSTYEEQDKDIYKTRYNADAHTTDTLEKLGFIKILSKKKWNETKFITFTLTEKGQLAINYDCIFDD